jgi:hypothetical protein
VAAVVATAGESANAEVMNHAGDGRPGEMAHGFDTRTKLTQDGASREKENETARPRAHNRQPHTVASQWDACACEVSSSVGEGVRATALPSLSLSLSHGRYSRRRLPRPPLNTPTAPTAVTTTAAHPQPASSWPLGKWGIIPACFIPLAAAAYRGAPTRSTVWMTEIQSLRK